MDQHPASRLPSKKFYKSFATRVPILCGLLALTVLLIGITEHACRSIPAHPGVGGRIDEVVSDLKRTSFGRSFSERQDSVIEPVDQSTTPIPSSPTPDIPSDSSSTEKPNVTLAPIGGYLCTKEDPSPQCQTSPIPPIIVPTPTPDIPESPSISPVSPNPEITAPTLTTTWTVLATHGSGYLSLGDSAHTAFPTLEVVVANGQSTTRTLDPVAPTSDVFVVGGKTTTLAPGQTPTPILLVSNGQTITQTPSQISKTSTPDGAPISGYLITNTIAAVHPAATIVNSTGTYYEFENGFTTQADQISQNEYIIVSFLPIVLALLYMIPFRILDSTIREHEPFYQLQRSGGALAQNSLTLDYSTSFTITTPFKSIYRGHFYIFCSSFISLIILLLAPLSSEALFVSLSGECGPDLAPCRAVWGIYPLLARIIEGILAFIAILILLLILLSIRRCSGVFAEPLSIASLATLLASSPTLRELREIDSRVSNTQLAKILHGKRYEISAFTSSDGRACYGIIPTDVDSEARFSTVETTGKKGHYQSVHAAELTPTIQYDNVIESTTPSGKSETWHAVLERLYFLFVFVLVGALLALITYYHWSSGETGFEHFMTSMGFGVRFMMATFGVLLNVLWSNIDHDLRLLSPYHTLLAQPSQARTTILAPVHASPLTSLLPSLMSRKPMLFLVALTAIASDFLPIFLANISFSPAMTKKAYTICTYISMSILSLMTVSILSLLVSSLRSKRWGGKGKLPREPVTIAGKAMFLVHGGLVERFEGMSILGTKERNQVVEGWERNYGMGVVDGGALAIDIERFISRFSG